MDLITSYQYLVDPDQVREALTAFLGQPVIGLDTETFWNKATRQNCLSLLQLAAPTGEVVVIDALAAGLEEARALIEDPAATMAAHNAGFDHGVLRQAGFAVSGLVDTLRLARSALRLPSYSLAAVTAHLFGLNLDKSYQQSNWHRRPLSREQLSYAALDALIALRVYQELTRQLEGEGRLDDELQRAQVRTPAAGGSNRRQSKRRSIQLRPLTSEERQLVERLRNWRRERAERDRIPTYLICHDKTFEHLAIVRPQTIQDLSKNFGLGPAKIARFGAELLTWLERNGNF